MRHWRQNNADSNVVSNRTIKLNQLFNPKMAHEEVESEAHSLGLEIEDYVPRFTDAELDEYYAAVKNEGYWQNFCNQIHTPGDNNGQMMQTLLSLPSDARYRWAFERDDRHVTDPEEGYVMKVYRDCLR